MTDIYALASSLDAALAPNEAAKAARRKLDTDAQRYLDEAASAQARAAELKRRIPAADDLVRSTAAHAVAIYRRVGLELALSYSAEVVKRHAEDPLRHADWITVTVAKIRDLAPNELDTPVNEKYVPHPLIQQALALVPPPSDIDRRSHFDFPERRKAIVDAELMNIPLQAA